MGKIYEIVDRTAYVLRGFDQPVAWPTSNADAKNYTRLATNVRQALTENWNEYSSSRNISQPLSKEWAK